MQDADRGPGDRLLTRTMPFAVSGLMAAYLWFDATLIVEPLTDADLDHWAEWLERGSC